MFFGTQYIIEDIITSFDSSHTLTAITCSSLSLEFGTIVYNPMVGPFNVDATATYSCNDGYTLSTGAASLVRTCIQDDQADTTGAWNPAALTCICEFIYVIQVYIYTHTHLYIYNYNYKHHCQNFSRFNHHLSSYIQQSNLSCIYMHVLVTYELQNYTKAE